MSFKRFHKRLMRVLLVILILSIVACAGLYVYRRYFGYQYDSSLSDNKEDLGITASEEPQDTSITNIALFGLDTRPGEDTSRSDTMMIVSIDNQHKKIKLISLMRDSYVEQIEGFWGDKLNAAYAYGGPALAIKTINQNFGTNIADYVAVDFNQVVNIVDSLGGVEIDVHTDERTELNRVIEDFTWEDSDDYPDYVWGAGPQTLSGVQALCYSRIRKGTGDDWARVERQGIVLSAIFDKLQDMSVPQMISLMEKLVPEVTCSIAPSELASMIVKATQGGMPTFEHTRVPLDNDWEYSSNGEFIVYDYAKAAAVVKSYIYDDIFPGSSTETGDSDSIDFSDAPTSPAGTDNSDSSDTNSTTIDPNDYVEEGGRYDSETGIYYDSDGDAYTIGESGNRIYS